ncbi:MAG: hypothetical protein Q4D38_09070 [Planctomycetia bacterium]|nr:hypothetical protein [Planctomycetia bacterium]
MSQLENDPLLDDNAFDNPFGAPLGGEVGVPADEETSLDVVSTHEDKPVQYRKPTMDVYTLLLFLALAFISTAAVFLYLESAPSEYGTPPFREGSPFPPKT